MGKNGSLKGYCTEVNVKFDMPTADVALRRVAANLENGRRWGCGSLKIIHGYGSTGRGGRIRTEVRRYLADRKARAQIRDFIPGESFTIFDEATRRALDRCPALRGDPDLERSNNGVTIVIF